MTSSRTWRATSQGPRLATERLTLTQGGHVRYALTNWPDCQFARPKAAQRAGKRDVPGEHAVSGRHHARDLRAGGLYCTRLAALVPKPRAHLTRCHGVFAPAGPDRAQHTRSHCQPGQPARAGIGRIEAPAVIERILGHLGRAAGTVDPPNPSRDTTRVGSVDLTGAAAPGPRAWTGAYWPAASPAGLAEATAKIQGPNDEGRERFSLDRGPRPATIPPIATRLDRFRCSHKAAPTAYPRAHFVAEMPRQTAQAWLRRQSQRNEQ